MINIGNSETITSEVTKIKTNRTSTWQEIQAVRPKLKGEEETSPKYLPTYIAKLFEGIRGDLEERIPAWENAVLGLVENIQQAEPVGVVSSGSGGRGGRGSDDATAGGTESVTPQPEQTPPATETEKPDITKLPINDLSDISDALYDVLTDSTLEEFIEDDNNKGMLKELLEQLPLTEEVKKQLQGMTAEDLADLLGDIYHGNRMDLIELSETSKNVMYEYLEGIAAANGITLQELLTNPTYSELLKAELAKLDKIDGYFEKLLTQDGATIQQNLLFVYNGNLDEDADNNVMNMVRILSDQMAQEKNVTVEELYTNPEFQNYIKEKVQDMEHTMSFLKVLSKTEGANAQVVTTKVLSTSTGVNGEASQVQEESNYGQIIEETYGSSSNAPEEVIPGDSSTNEVPPMEDVKPEGPEIIEPDEIAPPTDEGYGDVNVGEEEIPYLEPDEVGAPELVPDTEEIPELVPDGAEAADGEIMGETTLVPGVEISSE